MATYPKDFFDSWQGVIDRGLCFGIMPFDKAFDTVRETVKVVAQNDPFNLACLRADEVARPGCIMEDVLQTSPSVSMRVNGLWKRFGHLSTAEISDTVPFGPRLTRYLAYS